MSSASLGDNGFGINGELRVVSQSDTSRKRARSVEVLTNDTMKRRRLLQDQPTLDKLSSDRSSTSNDCESNHVGFDGSSKGAEMAGLHLRPRDNDAPTLGSLQPPFSWSPEDNAPPSIESLVTALSSDNLEKQVEAAIALRALARHELHRTRITLHGGISAFINGLRTATDRRLIRYLVGGLWNLAVNVVSSKMIVQEGVVPLLIKLLETDDPPLQRAAAGALRCLAWKHESNRAQIAAEGGVQALITVLETATSCSTQEQAAAALWNLGLNPTNSELISREGAVQRMVDLMASSAPSLQRLAAGVLRCLAYMFEPNRTTIANQGGIRYLCRLLSSPNIKVQQQAAAALGNLTYRNAPNRISVWKEGGIPPLLRLLDSSSSEVQLMAATTLRNLALNGASCHILNSRSHGQEENRVTVARYGGIGLLIRLLDTPKPDILVQTAASLWNLALNDQNKVIVCRDGGVRKLYRLLEYPNADVQYYARGALHTVGIALEQPQ